MNSQLLFLKSLKRNNRKKKTRVNVIINIDIIINTSFFIFHQNYQIIFSIF